MFHNLKDISIKLKNIEYNVDSIIYEQMKERYYNYNLNPVDKKLKTDLTAELITKKETKTHF